MDVLIYIFLTSKLFSNLAESVIYQYISDEELIESDQNIRLALTWLIGWKQSKLAKYIYMICLATCSRERDMPYFCW